MGLSPGGARELDGIFVNDRVIKDVGNLSRDAEADICIKLYFGPVAKRDGSMIEPTMLIYGDFQKKDGVAEVDINGAPVGWGSAFKVDRLINHIGGWKKELTSTEIPNEALLTLIDKKVYVLSYEIPPVNGKRTYRTLQILAAETETLEGKQVDGGTWLKDYFLKQVKAGKIKNYIHAPGG
jgi:hypothetical protein